MKNVVIIHGQLTHGGSERQLYNFLQYCDRAHYSPHLLISGELGYWEDPILALNVPITLLRGSPLTKLIQLRQYCVKVGADTLFSWAAYTNAYGLALSGTKIKRIGSFRNAKYAKLPERFRIFWRWASIGASSILVCNSKETSDGLQEDIRKNQELVYIPNGVEPIRDRELHRQRWRKKLQLADLDILIVGVGRLARQKNFGRFIEAVEHANAEYPCYAIIAGPDKGEGEMLCQKLATIQLPSDRVRLLGEVPDARDLICAADIFLLSSDFEGMPNVIMEAMAAGVPCVTTPVNGINALIEHNVHGWITEFDAEAIAHALVQLCVEPELRATLAASAKARIEQDHDPRQVAETLWALC